MSDAFDQAELLQQIDDDLEFLSEAVDMLRKDGPALIQQIRVAIEKDDRAALKHSAHTLKGMLGNFCAKPAFDAAARVESMADNDDFNEQTDQSVTAVEREVHRLESALDSLLHSG